MVEGGGGWVGFFYSRPPIVITSEKEKQWLVKKISVTAWLDPSPLS